jgi:hypothetical protein
VKKRTRESGEFDKGSRNFRQKPVDQDRPGEKRHFRRAVSRFLRAFEITIADLFRRDNH